MQSELFEAAKKNDIRKLGELLSANPELLHDVALTSAENPLHKACKHGSLEFAKKLIKLKPLFAKETNHEGFTALHYAAANGDVALGKELLKVDPKICLIEDRDSRIPLHTAVIKGKDEVIQILISKCPDSLKSVSTHGETALHLALKFNKPSSFKVLMKEVKKRKMEDLVNEKDNQGNTPVHLATIGKHCESLELLLKNEVAEVNMVNNSGFTALDIFNQTPNDMVDREIGRLLHGAGALEAKSISIFINRQSSSSQAPTRKTQRATCNDKVTKWPIDTRNVLLVVLIMTAGATFAAACNPPNAFVQNNNKSSPMSQNVSTNSSLGVGDVPSDSGREGVPPILIFMTLNTAGFVASMGAIGILVWSLPLREVVLFVLVTTFSGYVFSVNKVLPGLSVAIGSLHLLSHWFVWLCALALIGIGCMVWLGAEFCGSVCSKEDKESSTRTIEMAQF